MLVMAMAALGLMATPASAQTVSAANPESIAAVLRSRGYRAEVTKDGQGDPLIKSGADGSTFLIVFFNCTGGRNCATIQFYAGFKTDGNAPSLSRINEWNREKRFGRAYIDAEGDPVVEMDVDLDDGGMSRLLFEDNLEFWVSVLTSYKTFVRG